MASSGTITLLDLPSKPPCTSWSLNAWKTRFVLNYKGLDYKTEWVEFCDLEKRLKDHIPRSEGTIPYTIPTIILPDGTYVNESRNIANVLEEKYPEPSVHLDSPYVEKLGDLPRSLLFALLPFFLANVPRNILNEASHEYFYASRKGWVGMDVDQYEKEKAVEEAWVAATPALQDITASLKEKPEGPFFGGATVSYADFVWAGFLIFARRASQSVFDEVLKRSGDVQAHTALLEGLSPWSKRDDH